MATVGASGIVASYAAAWDAHDEGERPALLEGAWADDGVYCEPPTLVEGREALTSHIGGFHERGPGARVESSSGWRMLVPVDLLGPFPPG